MPQNPIDDKSTLVQVMAWCLRHQAITWTNVDPDLCHHMAWLGHNELTHVMLKIAGFLQMIALRAFPWITSLIADTSTIIGDKSN